MHSSLTPIYCTKTKPPPSSADADCIAFCASTGFPYLCKSTAAQPLLPAREWICTHLARECGLPVANCELITIEGRADVLFGSSWEPGTIDWWLAFNNGIANSNVLSKTLCFDFATQNGDRHQNNYLYLVVNGEILIKLIDFSRALNFDGWPMPSLPLDTNSNTIKWFCEWSKHYNFEKSDAEKVIDIWNALPADTMDKILEKMPMEWLNVKQREELIKWWASQDRIVRGNAVRSHLP